MNQAVSSSPAYLDPIILLHITEATDHFQDLATGGEHPTLITLVLIKCRHEFPFLAGVISFARGWVDLAAAVCLGRIGVGSDFFISFFLRHVSISSFMLGKLTANRPNGIHSPV